MSTRSRAAVLALPVAFLAVFFLWPVANIIAEGLHGADGWDLTGVGEVLGDPAMRRVLWCLTISPRISTASPSSEKSKAGPTSRFTVASSARPMRPCRNPFARCTT